MAPTAHMHGLTSAAAAERLARYGPNALPEHPPLPLWRRFARQFNSPLIYVLLFALAFDLTLWAREPAHGWPIEAAAIAVILLLNAILGTYQEQRSERALARLAMLAGPHAWVVRDGRLVHLPTSDVVPDDWVRLEAGDRIPADGVLQEAHATLLDESMLTGESLPVEKALADTVFSGTLLVRGKAMLRVTQTGPLSTMGRLATMLGGIQLTRTPLERRLAVLGRQVAIAVGALAILIAALGTITEGLSGLAQIVLFAVALAVAAVPEGLPAVVTVALSLGVDRMARARAVVRRLAAVEALGSVTVIATDKTGTLTENRMEVRALDSTDPPRALVAMTLANDADLAAGSGDPLDLGLLRYAAAQGVDVEALRAHHIRVQERTFDSAWKFARVTVRATDGVVSYVKGAPEVVLERCDLSRDDRASWAEKIAAYGAQGLRVLALACAPGMSEERLSLLGLVLLWDPPRPEVPGAVATARAAGIRIVMITGDHPQTALTIAHQIGIPAVRVLTGEDVAALAGPALAAEIRDVDVFARVRPEQKLLLVEALQAAGEIVSMTGDGVNDAAALKRADVGVAMGQRGSDVSREVADLVLLDDNFATIVTAIDEGRNIYQNIQTFLRFLFSTNLSEVIVIAAGAMLAMALDLRDAAGALLLPLTAAQILWINLLTDGFPAVALAFDRTPGVMAEPPRPANSPILDAPSLAFVARTGVFKALVALALLGLLPYAGYSTDATRAATFHFMAIGQLVLTYPSRHTWVRPAANPYLHAAVAAGIGLQVAAAASMSLAALLGHAALPLELWPILLGCVGVTWAAAETFSRLAWRR